MVSAIEITSTFWPTTLTDWLIVAGVLVGVITAIWKLAKLLDEINAVGERVNEELAERKKLEGRQDATEGAQKMFQVGISNLHETVGRLQSELHMLVSLTRDGALDRANELGEIRERLVRIETKVDDHRGQMGSR